MRRERGATTLQPTALVHEMYLRLATQRRARWKNRDHFFAVAAQVMRRVLVDHARRRRAGKRAGSRLRVSLAGADGAGGPGHDARSGADAGAWAGPAVEPRPVDLMALDRALEERARLDPRRARLAELRYFAGLNVQESARVLGVSPRTVDHEWKLARAWLHRRLEGNS
jgi:RNA polymerase sigma factor (sigma-70 family)